MVTIKLLDEDEVVAMVVSLAKRGAVAEVKKNSDGWWIITVTGV